MLECPVIICTRPTCEDCPMDKRLKAEEAERKINMSNNLPEGWQQRASRYDSKNNIMYIDAKSEEFVPAYLKYLLEFMKIPKDAKVVFTQDI